MSLLYKEGGNAVGIVPNCTVFALLIKDLIQISLEHSIMEHGFNGELGQFCCCQELEEWTS